MSPIPETPSPEPGRPTGVLPNEVELLRQEVQHKSAAELGRDFKDVLTKAQEVQAAIDLSLSTKGEVPARFVGEVNDKTSDKGKAVDVKKEVVKMLIAANTTDKLPTTIPGKPASTIEFANTVLQKISAHISPESISETTAPYLYRLMGKTLDGEITNVSDLAAEFKQIQNLKYVNGDLFLQLEKAMVEIAVAKGLSEKQAKELFGVQSDNGYMRERQQRFEAEWRDVLSGFFPEHKEFLEAIYVPEKFLKYVDKVGERIKERRQTSGKPPYDQVELQKRVSQELDKDIIVILSRPYSKVDTERPSELFEQIVEKDIMSGIPRASNAIERSLHSLGDYFKEHATEYKDRIFFKDADIIETFGVKTKTGEKDAEGKDIEKLLPKRMISFLLHPTETSIGDYVRFLAFNYQNYIDMKKYLHNTNVIFTRPKGEKGFWAQLKDYSEQNNTVDIDELNMFPDGGIIRTATHMYDKFVEEDFAYNDWKHNSRMFSPEINEVRNAKQKEIFNYLRKLYPMEGDEAVSDERIISALNMAIGASRGIYLNEVEKAAYADPELTPEGVRTFRSYYTKDPDSLLPFNPIHLYNRWQSEQSLNPILFLPVEGMASLTQGWDHTELWNNLQRFKDSYLNGKKAFPEGQGKLFIDYLMNMCKIGGPMTRAGWRPEGWWESAVQWDDRENKKINHLKTWKELENIGFDALKWYVNGGFTYKFFDEIAGKDSPAKRELFSYFMKRYFDKPESEFDAYYKTVKEEARKNILKKIKGGDFLPGDIDTEIEIEASNLFMYRALSRHLAQRIPTKFVRMERDRMSDDGIRAWEKVRQKEGWSMAEMDLSVKDLGFVETVLRKEASEQMREGLETTNKLHQIVVKYRLTSDEIERVLRGRLGNDEYTTMDGKKIIISEENRIKRAKDLFTRLQSDYSGNQKYLDNFGNLLRSGEYPFQIALDEIDTSFIAMRGSGDRMLSRALGDISGIEQKVTTHLLAFFETLRATAIDGKRDISKILGSFKEIKDTVEGSIGGDVAHKIIHHLSMVTISYFKKDMIAKTPFGLYGIGRKNSMAAEFAGRSSGIWEWEAKDIDNFCIALETASLLPKERFERNKKPVYVDRVINIPFTDKLIKLPKELKFNMLGKHINIPLFKMRKNDYEWYSGRLRKEFGGKWYHMGFDILNRYLPLLLLFLLWKYMQDALQEAEGKKK